LSEHTSPYDATVLIVDGQATLVIGGKPVTAKAGELVISRPGYRMNCARKSRSKCC
jgi:quercetin dioxygenase-like cupin family protein